jgi:predicted GNAT family acetyltransferase
MDVVHDEAGSRFVASIDGHTGELDYERLPDGVLDLIHTEVPAALQGRSVGNALAVAAFDYARANGLRVVLTCPFLRRWILSHPDQRDIVVWRGSSGAR